MNVAVDAHYEGQGATAAAVCFADWAAPAPACNHKIAVDTAEAYEPGAFYKREMPVILALLDALPHSVDCLIIDAFVWLGADRRPGLGQHLWQALDEAVPVIGVAKSAFADPPEETHVYRGHSNRPLFVTSAGIGLATARERIAAMAGEGRLPRLIRHADLLARGSGLAPDTRT